MKGLNIILIMLILPAHLAAQGILHVENLKIKGDRFYALEKYHQAAELYQEALNFDVNDPEINWKLAESYRKTFNYDKAEVYYRKLYFNNSDIYPKALYFYALMLKYNGHYEESLSRFYEFLQRNNENLSAFKEQAYVELAGINYLLDEDAEDNEFTAHHFPPPLNSVYHDFAPALLNNDAIVVTSGRVISRGTMLDERYGEAFTNNYYFQKSNEEWVNVTSSAFKGINTPYNDGSGSFSSTGDKYYFTICGDEGPECKIHVTSLKDGKWTAPVRLNSNININGYDAKQPSVSYGGDTLFFVSNRPGGRGMNDIWMSINSGDDDWGPSINLGNSINTKLNEISPKVTILNNTLLFSSEGHQGYGGFDIYMAKRLSVGDTLLYNIGRPFNSSMDDAFADVTDHNIVWSSNRKGGLGNFDLYYENIDSEISFLSWINLKKGKSKRKEVQLFSRSYKSSNKQIYTVANEDQLSYSRLSYRQKEIVDQLVQNELDINNIETSEDYKKLTLDKQAQLMKIAEMKWRQSNQLLQTSGSSYKIEKADLTKKSYITGMVKDKNNLPAQKVNVYLKGRNDELLKSTTTDENGFFRFTDLPERQGFFIKTEKYSLVNEHYAIADIEIREYKDDRSVRFENIYFDFDHYSLRPEAKKVLDELSEFLKEHENAQVEIFAHADGHGSKAYNVMLTRKRGEAVMKYLLNKGLKATHMAIRAEGKEEPIASNSDLIGRQLNRRVEFYINGANEDYSPNVKTFFIKDKMTVAELAEKAGIPVEDLRNLNGYTHSVQLKKYQPIRLYDYIKLPEDVVYTF